MKKKFIAIVTGMLIFSLTACTAKTADVKTSSSFNYKGAPAAISDRKEQIKVAVIKNYGADEHAAQILAGAKEEGESLGFKVDTFVTKDDAEFADRFNQVLVENYDAIFATHGQTNIVELVKKAVDKGIVVATFDSPKTPTELKNVVTDAQDDKELARQSLQALVDAFPGKTPNIIKMWVAGYPAQMARDVVYQEFVKAGKIKEVATLGEVGDFTNVAGLNANAMGAILSKFDKGKIDAVWAAWDAFATGAHIGLKENNRQEIQIFGMDVSNADLQLMQEKNSSWAMTAAADAKAVGVLNIRLIAKMLAKEEAPKFYQLPITSIYQKDLVKAEGAVTVSTLKDVYSTWGKSNDLNEKWMDQLREQNKK